MERFTGTKEQWCSEFARYYSDTAKTGLHEGKRVAELVYENFSFVFPKTAAAHMALDPQLAAFAKDKVDKRGAPRAS